MRLSAGRSASAVITPEVMAGALKSSSVNTHSPLSHTDRVHVNTLKGASIEYLCSFLNIPLEHTIAVGDEKNDVSMIRAANIGIAVKNAVQEAKDAADYITENDNNHDAIAEVISRFIFNEERESGRGG